MYNLTNMSVLFLILTKPTSGDILSNDITKVAKTRNNNQKALVQVQIKRLELCKKFVKHSFKWLNKKSLAKVCTVCCVKTILQRAKKRTNNNVIESFKLHKKYLIKRYTKL